MLKYYLTDKTDEPELRQLLRDTPMKGAYEISFLCEPDFFKAVQVQGRFAQTLGMRDIDTDELVGMGTRAVKTCYVNGNPTETGYLSSLRGKPQYQNGLGLIRGYRLFRQYHRDQRAKLYLSTIIEDNKKARAILESGRCGMPAYHDIGRFCSFAISLKQRLKCRSTSSLSIRQAKVDDITNIVHFLNTEGANKQFFPQYRQEDFVSNTGLLYGLDLNNVYLAYNNNDIVGIAAAWDQREFRQSMVTGYNSMINSFISLINVGTGLLGYPALPKQNTVLNYFNLGLVCIKNNDSQVFALLLNTIMAQHKDKYSFMMAGLHERDPLLSVLQKLKGISYSSRLYVVCWEDGEDEYAMLDDRIPYLELGAL